MAYTAAPIQSTYSSPQIPAAYPLDIRPAAPAFDTSSASLPDSGMVNLLPLVHKTHGKENQEIHAVTRAPIHAKAVGPTNGVCRGAYVWEKTIGTTYFFCIVGTSVYTSTDATTWTAVDTLSTNVTTPVRFTEFIDGTNVKKLVLVDGVEGYVYTTNAAGTKIVDADFPNPHIPFPVFMDGYLFLAKTSTGDIYNSDLNDPASWTAGSFISSELYPDDIQALIKVNNYLLAVGTQGCEYFYDAANAIASPLARYEGGSLPFGTHFPNSIANNKNTVVMVANRSDGENTVVVIEDFKHTDINPAFLISALNQRLTAASSPISAAALRGYFFRQEGKLFYGISFEGNLSASSYIPSTFAYSFDTSWWVELRYGATGASPFPVYFTALSRSGTVATYVAGHTSATAFFGKMEEGGFNPFVRTAADNTTGSFGTVNIYSEIRTPSLNFGTLNQKTMSRFGIILTDYTSTTATSVTINVAWADDDYHTFSTARQLTYSATTNFPFLTQLGVFRQRAFKLSVADGFFLRFKGLVMDINKGQQ